MIDLLKTVTFDPSQINLVWNNSNLVFKSTTEYRARDEILKVKTKTFYNFEIIKFHNRLIVQGSLHRFFNCGKHNANEFSVKNCIDMLNYLNFILGVNPFKFKVIGLEYGFNFITDIYVNHILKSLRFYNKKQLIESNDISNFFFCGNAYKGVKIYNKSQDCPNYSPNNNMRFEVKSRESQFIRKLGISSISDLLECESYINLGESIIKEWGSILLFDFNLGGFEMEHSTEYWLDSINMSRNTFNNRKNKYFNKLPKDSLWFRIKEKLIEKYHCAFQDYY